MYNAVYAEFLKLRHYRMTWLLVWSYPIAVGIWNIVLIGHDIFGGAATGRAPIAQDWIDHSALPWNIPIAFPGRWLIASFAAVAFAGEYGWNTWKLVIPARERWQLIVAKWIVVLALLYVALLVANLIMVGGTLLRALVGGAAIPVEVTMQAALSAHAMAFAHVAFPIVYTVALAGLLGVLTRSMLATAITSIAVITLEQFHSFLATLASGLSAAITRLALDILPFYHAANVVAYLQSNPARYVLLLDHSQFSTSWQASFAIMLVWISGLGAMTLVIFQRQDIN